MSIDLKVRQLRNGTTINVAFWKEANLQLDLMSQQESATYGGAGPFNRFNGYLPFVPLGITILADDKLVDSNNVAYSVVIDAEFFPDQHAEIVLDRPRGRSN